jgi:hypothetical protein
MNANQAQTVIFIATVIVLLLRLVVGLSYPWRQHRIYTFGLSLVAWIALYLRLIVNRGLDIGDPLDPVSTAVWLGVLVSQSVAVVYVYWPHRRT